MKEPSFRIENGKKIYSLECRVDAHRRTLDSAPPSAPDPQRASNSAATPNSTGKPQPPADAEDPDVVSVHLRVITADDAYPTMGWLGPQRVRYGHNQAQAISQMPDHMATRPRPVPLMWNHTYDVEKKAGRLANGYWEESTDIKPGVNAWAQVNRKYDPKAAMGLETGEIDATSVALWMDMERSHPDMPFSDFVEAAANGEEIGGQPVAWLPYKLNDVLHHAMVWSGADPNSGPRAIMNEDRKSLPDEASTKNAVFAAHNSNRGGTLMGDEKTALEILNSLCKDLGFDVILSEGAPIPDGLQAKLSNRATAYIMGTTRYSEIEARLTRMGEKYLSADSAAIAPLDILEALAQRLDLAVHGEKYLADLRSEALKAFDGAKVDPANKTELTASEKTIRELIERSSNVEQLKGFFDEYDGQKAAKFGAKSDMRTSAAEELPPAIPTENLTAEQRRIHASLNRWRGGK